MIASVLSKKQTHAFVECKCLNDYTRKKDIENELSSSTDWQSSINIIMYFFAIVLEKKRKEGVNVSKLIDDFYNLQDEVFLETHAIDSDFVEFMLKHVNPNKNNLEDTFIEMYKRWIEYDYTRTLRM